MEGSKQSLSFLHLALLFALLFCFSALIESSTSSNERDQEHRRNDGELSWCIAKPSTDNEKLNNNISFSCGQMGVDCKPIQPGGSCFQPNTFISHASFAMNLFYKSAGKNFWDCHFNGTGIIVFDNPSMGTCPVTILHDQRDMK